MTLPLLLLGLSSPALAHPGGHGEGEAPRRPPSSAAATITIPATYPEVTAALATQATAAGVALDAQKIVDLHRSARALADLTASMQVRATNLSAEAKATVAQKTVTLKEQVDALVAAADQGDTAKGKTALATIQADIAVLAALSP